MYNGHYYLATTYTIVRNYIQINMSVWITNNNYLINSAPVYDKFLLKCRINLL